MALHRAGICDARQQQRAPQPLGEVLRNGADERRLGRGERLAVLGSQERERAPGHVVIDEGGTQLVTKAVRRPELAVAPAAIEVPARGPAQRGRPSPRQCERPEGVEVLAAHLHVRHACVDRLRQPVLDDLAGRHERRGIHGQEADSLERNRASQHTCRS